MPRSNKLLVSEFSPAGGGVEIHRFDLPDAPPEGQIRVKIHAAPINPADLNYIEGTYGDRPELPAAIGMEGIGVVIAVGANTSTPIGATVFFIDRAGSWAELVDAPESSLLALPDGIDPLQGALLKVNPMTALRLLSDFATLPKGAWVIQNAANSSVGECVIQIAKQLGLRTANIVRREGLEQKLLSLGADEVFVDSSTLKEEVQQRIGEAPALGLNAVGGDSALRIMDILDAKGVMVTYGAMSRRSLKVPNSFLIFKQLRLEGFWVTKWIASKKREELAKEYGQLARWIQGGQLCSSIEKTYPLDDFKPALLHASRDQRSGKILFTP